MLRKTLEGRLSPVIAVLLGLTLAACTTPPKQPPGSGFLGDSNVYRSLEQSPRDANTWTWRAEGRSLGDFAALYIEPAQIYPAPASGMHRLDQDRVKEFAAAFREEIVAAVSPDYNVESKPSAGVLWIRPAITIIDPAMTFFQAESALAQPGKGAGGAAVEVEFLDGETKQRIAAVQTRAFADFTGDRGGENVWERPRLVLRQWAQTLRARLDEAHGRTPPPAPAE